MKPAKEWEEQYRQFLIAPSDKLFCEFIEEVQRDALDSAAAAVERRGAIGKRVNLFAALIRDLKP